MYTCILLHNITFVLMTPLDIKIVYDNDYDFIYSRTSRASSFQFVGCRSLEHHSPAKAARAAWQAKILRWLNHFSCQLVPIMSHFNLLVDSFVPMLVELRICVCVSVCLSQGQTNGPGWRRFTKAIKNTTAHSTVCVLTHFHHIFVPALRRVFDPCSLA